MRITFIPMVAIVIATLLHIPLCIFFVNGLRMGIEGLAIATCIKDAVLLAIVVIYGKFSAEIKSAHAPVDCETFYGWLEYIKIAYPSIIILCAEWWAFEIFTLMAGMIGVVALACNTIIFSIAVTCFMVA